MLGLLVSATLFTACGGDDNDDGGNPPQSNPVVGTWKVMSSDYKDFTVGAQITFKNDGTATLGKEIHENIVYKVTGNTLEIDFLSKETNNLKCAYKGEYTISGKTAYWEFILYEKGQWWEDHVYHATLEKQ